MEDINSLIREKLRAFRMIHFMMMMGSFTYGVVIVFIHLYAPIPPAINDASTLTTVTYGIFAYALIAVGIVRYMRLKLMNGPKFEELTALEKRYAAIKVQG